MAPYVGNIAIKSFLAVPHGGPIYFLIFESFFVREVALEPERMLLDGVFSDFKKTL